MYSNTLSVGCTLCWSLDSKVSVRLFNKMSKLVPLRPLEVAFQYKYRGAECSDTIGEMLAMHSKQKGDSIHHLCRAKSLRPSFLLVLQ